MEIFIENQDFQKSLQVLPDIQILRFQAFLAIDLSLIDVSIVIGSGMEVV